MLGDRNIVASVVDLLSVAPLDAGTVVREFYRTGRVVVVPHPHVSQ